MSVTVQIPDTSAFQEVILPDGYQVTGMLVVGNYLYVIETSTAQAFAPGRIVQLEKANLNNYTIITFPDDERHMSPTDLVHSTTTGHVYIAFANIFTNDVPDFHFTVSRVTTTAPFTLLSDFVSIDATYMPGPSSITVDDSFLYATAWTPPTMLRFRFSDANLTATPLSSPLTSPTCIRASNGKLFLGGFNFSAPTTQWVARMSLALAIEQTATFSYATDFDSLQKPFGVSADHLWIGNESNNGLIKRVLKNDLNNMSDVATGQLTGASSVCFDSINIWELFVNGRGARISPVDSTVSLYTVNSGQGFHREIAGDGIYVYAGGDVT